MAIAEPLMFRQINRVPKLTGAEDDDHIGHQKFINNKANNDRNHGQRYNSINNHTCAFPSTITHLIMRGQN